MEPCPLAHFELSLSVAPSSLDLVSLNWIFQKPPSLCTNRCQHHLLSPAVKLACTSCSSTNLLSSTPIKLLSLPFLPTRSCLHQLLLTISMFENLICTEIQYFDKCTQLQSISTWGHQTEGWKKVEVLFHLSPVSKSIDFTAKIKINIAASSDGGV